MATKHELTEQQEKFLEALFGEAKGDFRTAMRMAGYSDGTRLDQMRRTLADEIVERAKHLLAASAPKAVFGLDHVLDNPTDLGNNHKIAAASQILDRVGLSKLDRVEVTAPGDMGIFFLPPKDEKK